MYGKTDYKKLRVEVLDFTLSVKEFANIINILNGYYQHYCSEYNEYWRLNEIINLLVSRQNDILCKMEELRKNFNV